MRLGRRRGGASLIEVLVSLAIVAILAAPALHSAAATVTRVRSILGAF